MLEYANIYMAAAISCYDLPLYFVSIIQECRKLIDESAMHHLSLYFNF